MEGFWWAMLGLLGVGMTLGVLWWAWWETRGVDVSTHERQ